MSDILLEAACGLCSHKAYLHEGGSCSGPTGSGNPCRCNFTPEEIGRATLCLFGGALSGNGGSAGNLVARYKVDRGGVRFSDEPAMRIIFLESSVGRNVWDAYVKAGGFQAGGSAARVTALSLSFPSLKEAADNDELQLCRGWSPLDMERWAWLHASDGAKHAALFVLGVWSSQTKWACGKFDFHNAWKTWDDAHRAAFMYWIQDPWWA